MTDARTTLDTFTLDTIPTLDVAVVGALDLFAEKQPSPVQAELSCPLVVGSVGARYAAGIMFGDTNALFADEADFISVYERNRERIDGAILVSASGGKHAPGIAKALAERDVRTILLTNNRDAPAADHIAARDVHVFPRNREPYTYNTSTYLGMILSATGEHALEIQDHITEHTAQELSGTDFKQFSAFTIIVPTRFAKIIPMVRTKFDELFGPFVSARVFTAEEIKHAKTVVTSKSECFLGLDVQNNWFGLPQNRISVSLPKDGGYGSALAIAYYAIGQIQNDLPPYFVDNIAAYAERASELFGHTINPIVESTS